MINVSIIAIAVSIVALLFSLLLSWRILRVPAGNQKMQDIAQAIKEGAMAYMKRQYKTIALFAVGITVILALLFPPPIAIGFVVGALWKS